MSGDAEDGVRGAFVDGLCGAVMVRNLRAKHGGGGLLDVYCEVVHGGSGRVIFRSGVAKDTLNPTWTLRSRVRNARDLVMDDMEAMLRIGDFYTVRVFRVGKLLPQQQPLDSFPYHHTTMPEGDELILEKNFQLRQLANSGLTTSELHKVGPIGPNHVMLGLHHSRLPLEFAPAKVAESENSLRDCVLGPAPHNLGDATNLFVWHVSTDLQPPAQEFPAKTMPLAKGA
jgi:hypothetical protein